MIVPLGWPGGLSAQAAADNSRDALALAYLQLDYLLRDTPLPPETRSGFNRAFDGATLLFFGGRFDQARNRIDSLATVLVPQRLARDAAAAEATAVLARLPAEQLQLPGTNGAPIPYHLYVPPDAAGRAVPLLVVLHGAGGDERMFFAGYGAGEILSLARKHGFAVVSPPTAAVMNQPLQLDALIAAVEAQVAIDPLRVYLLGHSMGAGAAWGLARQRSDRVAAVACIAGACGAGGAGPPALVVAAEVDPLATPAQLEAVARRAREEGRGVEYWLAEGWGHTLVVGAVLPEAVAWLLGHRRGETQIRPRPLR